MTTRPRTRHPVRGLAAGLVFGLGLVLLLIVLGVAAFTSITPFVVIVAAAAVAGLAFGRYGPQRLG
jgi:high-affinity Fe2+/Pb2+ permease